eukprot:3857548-Pyramimonas_sp.AAC.1
MLEVAKNDIKATTQQHTNLIYQKHVKPNLQRACGGKAARDARAHSGGVLLPRRSSVDDVEGDWEGDQRALQHGHLLRRGA